MLVEGFDPRYIKMCYFATLGELGYRTRVSLANGMTTDSPLVDDLHVSFEAFTSAGRRLGSVDPFEVIPPGGFTSVEVESMSVRAARSTVMVRMSWGSFTSRRGSSSARRRSTSS